MEIKKYPNAALENYSRILMLLGFVLALFIVYEFIQMRSYPRPIKEISALIVSKDDDEVLVEIKPMEVQTAPAPKTAIPEKIIKVEDEIDIEETVIESTETDETEAVIVDVSKDIVDVEEEEVMVEDVAFVVIEDVPIYPGCTGNKQELRDCFSEKISQFVMKNFDPAIATDLGLQPGSIQRIFVMFKIDRNGKVTNIQARAPHKKLQEEAVKIIGSLPVMTPGKQRGRPVTVSYGLPIVFKIE
ncbi:energy transducer TonB [Lutibacter sp. A64]|uniref:energy transducer TonB n=1 Tax=Lutibacter sp. A64 TaxID=2918526 RepID=UPI001F05A335|nr:energy transducer TonB [Lutibacter sp. A64]UMB52753.1 energy transducer TonB [Lutibacter sp. A64]